MSKSSAVPSFYRIFFTSIDPLLALWGAYMHFFTPDVVLNAYIPSSHSSYPTLVSTLPLHNMLFHQAGGFLLQSAFLSAVLLRYSSDVRVWKLAQTSILIVDVAMLFGLWWGLSNQGRLRTGDWRAEDWGSVGITVVVAVIRSLFVAGVGVGEDGRGKRE